MSKVEVKTHLVEENGYTWLVLERPDGSLAAVDIFNGGGYVSQITFTNLPIGKTIEQIHIAKGGNIV